MDQEVPVSWPRPEFDMLAELFTAKAVPAWVLVLGVVVAAASLFLLN